MALARESSGTQTATIGTEHSLATPTTAKTRVLVVNLTNLAAGDILELRIKSKVLAAGSEVLGRLATVVGPVTELRYESPPVATVDGATFTLKQTAGTGRSFEWSVLSLD
jgi:hypothetical protein